MKKLVMVLSLFLLISVITFAQNTIQSTTVGGLWNSSNTWEGGIIPGENDNVVINGSVVLNYHSPADAPDLCNDLLINSGGQLSPGSYGGGAGTYILRVYGNATINGTINAILLDDRIHIYLYGDLTCNSNWTPYQTIFAGTSDRTITMAEGSYIHNTIIKENEEGKIFAGSDLEFRGDFSLGGSTLEMGNYNLIGVTSCRTHFGRIKGDFGIKGNFIVWDDDLHPLYMEGGITVIDTLQNDVYGGGSHYYNLFVEGNLINNGVIKDLGDGDMLTINITGDVTNNGIWENSITNFTGTGVQNITQDDGKFFEKDLFDLDSLSEINALTDISINGNFSLGRARLNMDGHQLRIGGWLKKGFLNKAVLNNGFLQNIVTEDSLRILGKVTVDENNIFMDRVVVDDTLQSNQYGGGNYVYVLTVNADITNNGVIKNISSGDQLSLEITGDIINNGVWENTYTKLSGSETQNIYQDSDRLFTTNLSDLDSNSAINALSDLRVTGNVDLGRALLQMNSNEIWVDGYLTNGYLESPKIKNAVLLNVISKDSSEIRGVVEIDDGNYFYGNLIITDTLQAALYGSGAKIYNLINYGNIENNGLIRNQPAGSGSLSLYIAGNIINKGEFNNYTVSQLFFKNYPTKTISCYNNSNQNWQFNGSSISGSGMDNFSIISGGGIETIPADESYDLILRFESVNNDSIAILNIDCTEIGTLSNLYLIGYNYDTTVGVDEKEINAETNPKDFYLFQNYPNPFNPATVIRYSIPVAVPSLAEGLQNVTLKIYDILGNEVTTLVNENQSAGNYEVTFNASGLASGIYLYKLQTSSGFIATKKLMLLK